MNNKPISTSRRTLIKGAAAATVGIPYVIPSGVLALPGKRLGANDRIVYGHIGVGGQGSSHVVTDSAAGICDVDSNHLAENVKRCTSSPIAVKDYRYLLDRKDIDAVTIGTPDHWHAIQTVHACQAGKDVYSEKPVCRTIQEARAMVNATEANKRVVQIGAQGRSGPNPRYAAQFIRNGQIGKVSHVEVWHPENFTQDDAGDLGKIMPPPPELDWDLWLGPARMRPYNPSDCHFNFRWIMDIGGGFIRDRGNHVLSIVMMCMGADTQGPVSVEATGDPNKVGSWDVPVTMEAKWEFKNPDWTLTWSQPGTRYKFLPTDKDAIEWGAKYHGDRDTLLVSGGDDGCDTEQKAKEYKPPSNGYVAEIDDTVNTDDVTERHRRNWRHCIKTREKPIMNIWVGANVIVLPIIANISYQLGHKLQWDHAKQMFVGDEEANRMLAQPYRAPFHL